MIMARMEMIMTRTGMIRMRTGMITRTRMINMTKIRNEYDKDSDEIIVGTGI